MNKKKILLKKEFESMFKTRQAVNAVFAKMSVRGDRASYSYLDPTRGNGNFFKFVQNEAGTKNVQGQTYLEFFAHRLADAINQG